MKKLFAILILSVFMLSFASATNWDNYLKYEKETDTITIKNTFGLGRDLIKAQLKNNFCDEEGRFCEADKTIELFEEGALIEDWKTLRLDDGSDEEQNIRWHKFEYFGTINDYETQCEEIKIIQENGTSTKQVCEHVKIGEHKDWIQFKEGDIFSKGIYQVKTTGEIRPGRVYDWQIKIAGKWTTPWEIWGVIGIGGATAEVILNSPANGSILYLDPYSNPVTFNTSVNITGGATVVNRSLWTNESGSWEQYNFTDLSSYYRLDETTGAVIDQQETNNGTNSGATTNVAGIISTAYDFEAGDVDYISMGDVMDFNFLSESFSASFWVKLESTGATNTFIAKQDSSSPYDGYSLAYDSSGRLVLEADATGSITIRKTTTLNTGEWYHLVFTYNGSGDASGVKMYINSTEQTGLAIAGNDLSTTTATSQDFKIGARGSVNINPLDGIIDEVGIWNKTLSQSDVTGLYNSGIGQRPESLSSIWEMVITNDIIWNSQACDSDGDCGFAPNNYSLFIDKTIPTISITSPNETFNYLKLNQIINLNVTATDSNLNICWYNYNGANQIFSCTTGIQANETFLQELNNFNITVYANDSIGNENNETVTWSYKVFENSRTLNSSSYETQSELFQIDVTDGVNLTAVTLDYNGTEYSTTESEGVYSKTLDVPIGVQNRSVRWKFTYAGDTIYSDYSYQNISEVIWTLCNTNYTDTFLNISFKDESNLSSINASIPTSTFEYYLGSGLVTKSYTYENTTSHLNYSFCATPDLTFNVDLYIQYKQGTDYPQRIYDPDVLIYNSTVTNKILYLLNTIDGIYVTFQVINSAQQGISSVGVSGTRLIDEETVAVANGLTDAAGAVTFWLNPDFQHEFTFSKTGYETTVYTVTPTQSTYTITLGGGVPSETDCTRGVSYQINPSNNFLDQNTEYDFSFTIDSSYWALTKFNISLYYGNDTLIDSDSSTTQGGGTLTFNSVNTTNQTEMYLKYAYEVNDSICLSTSTNWIVQSIDGRDYSIWYLFTQSSEYLDANLYGVKGESGNNDFGKIVIVFLIVVLIAGISIQKFGIQSEPAIMSIIFAVVAMLDFGLNFIPTIQVGDFIAIPHFVTVVTFIMWLAFLWKER